MYKKIATLATIGVILMGATPVFASFIAPPPSKVITSLPVSVAQGGTGVISLTGLVLASGANAFTAYSGVTCANAFLRILDLSGNGTCNAVTLTSDVTGTLPILNGGTNQTAFGTTNGLVAFDGTRLNNFANYTLTSALLSTLNASSTLFSAFGPAYFGGSATSSFSTAGVLTLVANGLVVGTNQLVASGGNVGVGTSTATAEFAIQANSGTNYPSNTLFLVASSTATATTTEFSVTNVGHIIASSTNPVLSSCGTNPTLAGDDTHGTVTSGTLATACTLTFQVAYSAAPACVVTSESATSTFAYARTATAITVTDVSLTADKWDYICEGVSGLQ